ncbi:glycosyltransferase [Chromohalobacter canadensis]|nr:glycosyltransferase [Chromohalobacter canadensis]MCT8498561.1 glycosyltransferase [Chromohalobacter canadensis]
MDARSLDKKLADLKKFTKKEIFDNKESLKLDIVYFNLLLNEVFSKPEPLSAMTSWSVAPEFSWWLYSHIVNCKYKSIVELGSGTSTVVIGEALKKNGYGKVVSFEHNEEYYKKTQKLVQDSGVSDYVKLILAPLKNYSLEGETYKWYDICFDHLRHILYDGAELVLIDGPPAATNRHARYPALPLLKDFVKKEAIWILDDAAREEEQEILERWVKFTQNNYISDLLPNVRHSPALFFKKDEGNLEEEPETRKDPIKEILEEYIYDLDSKLKELGREKLVSNLAEQIYEKRDSDLFEYKVRMSQIETECESYKTNLNKCKNSLEYVKKNSYNLHDAKELVKRSAYKRSILSEFPSDTLPNEYVGNYLERLMIYVVNENEKLQDVVIEQTKSLKEQKNREKKIRASLAFKVGSVISKNIKSPYGWLKMPFSLCRVAIRHKRSRQPAVNKKSDGKSVGKQVNNQKTPSSLNTLWNAKLIWEDKGIEEALRYARKNADEVELRALNLFEANKFIYCDEQWVGCVNSFLYAFSLSGVSLAGNSEQDLFNRILAEPDQYIERGPLVSIIMPAYNAETTLEFSVKSILAQSWKEIELIIVDDFSTDNTWVIANKLANEDSRIKLLRNACNVGPYVSKNRALPLVQGDYLTGHDADDWAHPERIEKHVQLMLDDIDVKASVTKMVRISREGGFPHVSKKNQWTSDGLSRTAFISCMFEAKFFRDKIGHWDTVKFGADSEIIARAKILLDDNFKVYNLPSMFCLDSELGLTNDPKLGLSTPTGLSPVRKAYANSWRSWHSSLNGDKAWMPFPNTLKAYSPPEEMQVDKLSLEKVINGYLVSNHSDKPSIFFVYFDPLFKKIFQAPPSRFDLSFYESPMWPSRPNSTSRLGIANLQSLIKLKDDFSIFCYYAESFDDVIREAISIYDYVVINQNPSQKTFSFINDLLDYQDMLSTKAEIIFGTEVTWFNEEKKGNFSRDRIESIYSNHLLLRHTPKTDREIYSDSSLCSKAKVLEFNLGIDTSVVKPAGNKERKYITFVKAPEGRKTKNNDFIYDVIQRVKSDSCFEEL